MEESIETKVKKALESIRPFLNNDGGDIELVEIKDNKNRHNQYKIIIINNWTGDVLGLNPICFYLF